MAEGLRERKKRQTRQNISDVATGLFLDRGFEAVTVAEIAAAAEVSVNTVYNYFPAKEDLFLDREAEVADRMAAAVRGRRGGESAARAVLRGLREELVAVSPAVGLVEGYERFIRVILESPALSARIEELHRRAVDGLAAVLRAEAAAGPEDPEPALVAGALGWVNTTVLGLVSHRMAQGGAPQEVAREALAQLDVVEELLGARLLNYAVKNTP